MRLKGGSIWGGYSTPYEKFAFAVEVGQRYLMENTTLGIPALIQSEGDTTFNCCYSQLTRASQGYTVSRIMGPFFLRPSALPRLSTVTS